MQLEELRALQLNVEHELSSLRQKLIHHSTEQEALSSKVEKAQTITTQKNKAFDDLKARFEQIAEDNEALQEQVTYLESERASYQQYREQTQGKIDDLIHRNREMESQLETLRRQSPKEPDIHHAPGGLPRVRRIDPRQWREMQKDQAQEEEIQKDETSRLKTRQAKSTDRFNRRDESSEPEKKAAAPPPPPKPVPLPSTQAIPIRNAEQPAETDPRESAAESVSEPETPEKIPSADEPRFGDDDAGALVFEDMDAGEAVFDDADTGDVEMDVTPGFPDEEPDEDLEEDLDFERGTDPGIFPKPYMDESLPDVAVPAVGLDSPDEDDDEAAFLDTVQDDVVEPEELFTRPVAAPPPRPAPARDPAQGRQPLSSGAAKVVDPERELAAISGKKNHDDTADKKRKKLKKKKKPSTVRVDITSSDIIDSFKRELGLPDK